MKNKQAETIEPRVLRGSFLLALLKGWLNKKTSAKGCTAVDAVKLRAINHDLIMENEKLWSLLETINHTAWRTREARLYRSCQRGE